MAEKDIDKKAVVAQLNKILEAELAGVVRYTHYSFMVYGYNRIPIVSWLRAQASESMLHATEAGELITHFGEHPSLGIGPLLEGPKHDVAEILRGSYEHEERALGLYKELLGLVEGRSVMMEEYARKMVVSEETHLGEVAKMMRGPSEAAEHRKP